VKQEGQELAADATAGLRTPCGLEPTLASPAAAGGRGRQAGLSLRVAA
jgi:hypothetical protein